jgi:transposase
MTTDDFQEIIARLERIETQIVEVCDQLAGRKTVKAHYSTAEVAEALGKAEFTVREWCRNGRVRAEKRPCGRGRSQEWMIGHDELTRIRNEGLLPLRKD